jgi:hypothetical protein
MRSRAGARKRRVRAGDVTSLLPVSRPSPYARWWEDCASWLSRYKCTSAAASDERTPMFPGGSQAGGTASRFPRAIPDRFATRCKYSEQHSR